MAYIKAYDVTIVTAFRATVAKFPNRVMYVNASIGTEWTYSKVMGVKLPLIYHFSLHLRDSGGGCCCLLVQRKYKETRVNGIFKLAVRLPNERSF